MLRSGGGGSSVGNEFVPNSASSGITLGVLCFRFLICEISDLGKTFARSTVMFQVDAQCMVPDREKKHLTNEPTNQSNTMLLQLLKPRRKASTPCFS